MGIADNGESGSRGNENNSSKIELRRIILGVIVSILSLAAVLYFTDFNQLINALRLADYRLIGYAVITTFIWLFIRTAFWRTLLREKATFKDVFWTINEGYLINNLLPLRLGEFARAYLLSRKSVLTFWEIFSTIVIERVLDLTIAVGFLFGAIPTLVGGPWELSVGINTAILVSTVLIMLFILARYRDLALNNYRSLGTRFPLILRIGGNAVPEFLQGLSVLTDGWRFVRAVGLAGLNWGFMILQYYILLRAFFPEAEWFWAIVTLTIAALGMSAPSSPGALGVFEAAVVGALQLFGVDASIALAMAITTHLLQYLVTGVLGVYGLIRDGESLLGLFHRIRGFQPGTAR